MLPGELGTDCCDTSQLREEWVAASVGPWRRVPARPSGASVAPLQAWAVERDWCRDIPSLQEATALAIQALAPAQANCYPLLPRLGLLLLQIAGWIH